jgi:hypothetical protein
MRELTECLEDWLRANPSNLGAHRVVAALAAETHKRAGSTDPTQREFDTLELAQAAFPGEYDHSDYDAAKRKLERLEPQRWTEARQVQIEDWFRQAGHVHALRLVKHSGRGRHRAQWSLQAYELPTPNTEESALPEEATPRTTPNEVTYDFTAPGGVRPSWLAWPWLRDGRFETRSPLGLLWLGSVVAAIVAAVLASLLIWGMSQSVRPLMTADVASLLLVGLGVLAVWRFYVRPSWLLVEDRIRPAPDALVAASEARGAQIEFTKIDGTRVVQLVRYSGACPICAGELDLRLGGTNGRRLLGCCSESPQEHVYSFDRVTRRWRRIDS